MEPVLYGERGYGAPLKVSSMRLFTSLDEALQFVVINYAVNKQEELLSVWMLQLWKCVTPGEKLKKINAKDIIDSATYRALPV